MSSTVARSLVAIAAVLVMRSVLYGSGGGDIPPMQPQKCDGTSTQYTAPAGTATGTGTSAERAGNNSAVNAAAAVGLSVNPCALCSNQRQCQGDKFYNWTNYHGGTPVYDPILGVWTVTVRWDGCTITQVCHPCN